jgi:uncharacterized protein YndB with AHSA1/START domain
LSNPPVVKVVVKRRFNACPERVFDAWLDRNLIGQWMFGPKLRDFERAHRNKRTPTAMTAASQSA